MKAYVLISGAFCLAGCVESRPFPKERFQEIAKRCGFTAVTYTARKSFWKDEPLIDFSGERNRRKAMECFDETDLAISKENTNETDLGIAFIWEQKG